MLYLYFFIRWIMINIFSEQNPALKNLWLSTSNECQNLNSESKNSVTPQLINIVPIRTAGSVPMRQQHPVPLFWNRDVLQRTDQKNDVTTTVRIHLNVSESTSWLLSFQTLNIKNNEQSSCYLFYLAIFSWFFPFFVEISKVICWLHDTDHLAILWVTVATGLTAIAMTFRNVFWIFRCY